MERAKFSWRAAVLSAILATGASASANTSPPVEASLYSTMASTFDHRPEMAMDGDSSSYYYTTGGMDDGDDFLVILSRPISVSSIRIISGDPSGNDLVKNGFVESSSDGVKFSKVASFDDKGVAATSFGKKQVMAVKIRLNQGSGISKLAIREIEIKSSTKIAHVQTGPPRGFVDISQAPDLAQWADRAEKQMESFWLDTAAILYTDKYITPNAVNVIYRTGPKVTPVAATGGGVMEVNSAYCREHLNDTGLTVHETAHVVQAPVGGGPGWLIEGIADYIRWIKFEPEHFHPRINVERATYHDAYQTTATFLGWCALKYDPELVTTLNRACRFGGYTNDLFKTCCGKDVNTLWDEFIAAYKADSEHIITPPIPLAMQPRNLPDVQPSSSVQVDLSSFYNLAGISADQSKFSGGFDGEDAAYSSKFVHDPINYKNVLFKIGAPNTKNVMTSTGQTVPLPSGSYKSIWLLASSIDGSSQNQTLTVTYTDGTTQTMAQNFSDWYQPENFPGEGRAVASEYRDMGDGTRDGRSFYVYGYGFALDPIKIVKSITLPDTPNLRFFSISVSE